MSADFKSTLNNSIVERKFSPLKASKEFLNNKIKEILTAGLYVNIDKSKTEETIISVDISGVSTNFLMRHQSNIYDYKVNDLILHPTGLLLKSNQNGKLNYENATYLNFNENYFDYLFNLNANTVTDLILNNKYIVKTQRAGGDLVSSNDNTVLLENRFLATDPEYPIGNQTQKILNIKQNGALTQASPTDLNYVSSYNFNHVNDFTIIMSTKINVSTYASSATLLPDNNLILFSFSGNNDLYPITLTNSKSKVSSLDLTLGYLNSNLNKETYTLPMHPESTVIINIRNTHSIVPTLYVYVYESKNSGQDYGLVYKLNANISLNNKTLGVGGALVLGGYYTDHDISKTLLKTQKPISFLNFSVFSETLDMAHVMKFLEKLRLYSYHLQTPALSNFNLSAKWEPANASITNNVFNWPSSAQSATTMNTFSFTQTNVAKQPTIMGGLNIPELNNTLLTGIHFGTIGLSLETTTPLPEQLFKNNFSIIIDVRIGSDTDDDTILSFKKANGTTFLSFSNKTINTKEYFVFKDPNNITTNGLVYGPTGTGYFRVLIEVNMDMYDNKNSRLCKLYVCDLSTNKYNLICTDFVGSFNSSDFSKIVINEGEKKMTLFGLSLLPYNYYAY